MGNLIAYCIIMFFTPGPNNIICLSIGTRYGYRKALPYSLGVGCGCVSIVSVFIVLGEMAKDFSPDSLKFLGYIGSVYLIYLAYKIFMSKPHHDAKESPKESAKESVDEPVGFKTAIFLQLINPKGYMFCITLVSTFIEPLGLNNLGLVILVICLGVMAVVSTSSWALFGTLFNNMMSKYYKWINAVLAMSLVFIVVKSYL